MTCRLCRSHDGTSVNAKKGGPIEDLLVDLLYSKPGRRVQKLSNNSCHYGVKNSERHFQAVEHGMQP